MLGPLLGGSVFTFGLILAVALAGIGIGGLLYALTSERSRRVALGIRLVMPARGGRAGRRLRARRPARRADAHASAARIARLRNRSGLLDARDDGRSCCRPRSWPAISFRCSSRCSVAGATSSAVRSGSRTRPTRSARSPARWPAASACSRGCRRRARGDSRRCCSSRLASPRWRCRGGATGAARSSRIWRSAGGSRRSRWPASARPVQPPSGVTAASARGARRATLDSSNQFRDWVHAQQRAIVWDEDGTESSVALAAEPNGYAFIVNGKSDGSARGDAGTQVMLGAARRDPESGGAPLAGDRSRHRQLRRLARRGSRHGSGRRRRARAADRRRGARVRRGQPRRAAQPESAPDDWRCARNAADRARWLRPHRVGTVESVPRRRRESVHA